MKYAWTIITPELTQYRGNFMCLEFRAKHMGSFEYSIACCSD